MNPILLFFLALLPIVWLIFALTGLKMIAYKACLGALGISAVLALFVWKMAPLDCFTAALEGAALALWPIILVIIAALFTYNLTLRTGAMDDIKYMISGISTDKRILVLLIGWCFGGFLEGIAGFGTAVAIPASMLIALGFEPLPAAVACLVSNAMPTAFGSIGIPTMTLSQITKLDILSLSFSTILQMLPILLLTPFIMVALTGKSFRALRGIWPVVLTAGLSFIIPAVLVARFLGAELPVIVGSVCSLGATVLAAKRHSKKATPAEYAISGNAGITRTLSPKRALIAWAPFILIFVFLLLTSSLLPSLHNALASVKTAVTIYSGEVAAPYTFVWLATPGVLIFIAALIGGTIQGAKASVMLSVFKDTVVGTAKTIFTILSILATAKIMSYSGMISAIAVQAAAYTGRFYPVISPIIGALGSFVTGSGTSSSVLFGKLQVEAAVAVGADPVLLAASNTVGAGIGKIISPQCISIAVAATGLAGQEGELLRRTVKWALVMLVVACAVSALSGIVLA